MSTKNIGIRKDVYERLKAHKRGNESFSETLDRLLDDVDEDWRNHIGFLGEEEANALEAEVERGRDDLDESLDELGAEIDTALAGGDEDS